MKPLTKLARGLVAIALLAMPGLAQAQTESGKVAGTITDSSSAVLPGATVVLRNTGSQARRQTTTDTSGAYSFAALTPGEYELTVELAGFSSRQMKARVPVGASVTLNARLEVGTQTEQITVVAGDSVPVNTSTQDISVTVSERQLRELPTITRNPYDLVQLSGNVNDSQVGDNDANFTPRGANGFNLNGQRASGTNVLLDGAGNNDEYTASVGQAVPLDSVQEFSVITSNFSAQYGRATGGIVNVATKSGTNEFRGTVYDFFRNAALATNTFDNKARGIDKGDFDRSQMGFSIGGPLQKDKLHFFVSGEYIRVRSQAPDISIVPTPELLARTSAATQAYFKAFPLGIPINGPVITAGQINGVTAGGPFSQLPSNLPVFGEVQRSLPVDAGGGFPVDDYQLVSRLDWNLGPNSQAYVRYAFQDQSFPVGSSSNSPYKGFDTAVLARNHNLLGSFTHVFSPKLTSQTKFVYVKLTSEQPLGEQPPVPGLYMRTSQTTINGIRIALPGYLPYNPGLALPSGGPQQQFQAYQDLNLVAGHHDLRFGGSFVRLADDHTFGAFESSVQTLGANFGQALDNLMLGQLSQFNGAVDPQGKYPGQTLTLPVGAPAFFRNNRYNEFAVYANDSWSVTSRLKLNLGMRYEYFGVQHNTDPSLDSNFYLGPGSNIFEQIKTGSVQVAPKSPIGSLWKPDWNNFAPRVGFAWDVTGDGRTSIRGGYGIGYERNFGNVTFNVIQNPPNYAVLGLAAGNGITIPITLNNAGPLAGTGTAVLPAVTLRSVDPNIKNAYAHFWSLSLQREVVRNTMVSLEYTGSAGQMLYDIDYANRPGAGLLSGESAPNRLDRPNAQYGNINQRGNGGFSRYHGFNFGLESRQIGSTGLSLTARYTLSWAKDNLSSTFSDGANVQPGGIGYLDALDKALDYGYAQFDVRHRFVASGIWEMPFFKNSTGAKKTILGGWQLAYIFSAQSGAPFTEYDCTNEFFQCARMALVAPVAGYTNTPVAGAPNTFTYLDLSNQTPGIGSIFNAATGTNEIAPAGGYPANMTPRGAFRRPGRWNTDASLSKRFRFNDRVAVQLRFEVYNLFNHANLYINDADADISGTTTITAFRGFTNTAGVVGDGQRRIQLGAKFEF